MSCAHFKFSIVELNSSGPRLGKSKVAENCFDLNNICQGPYNKSIESEQCYPKFISWRDTAGFLWAAELNKLPLVEISTLEAHWLQFLDPIISPNLSATSLLSMASFYLPRLQSYTALKSTKGRSG